MVECLTRDRRVVGWSLIGGTVFICVLSKTLYLVLIVLVQPRKTHLDMSEKLLTGT